MANADVWVHPTVYTGEYPHGFNGFTYLDWDSNSKVYHPGDDYNFGGGDDDLGKPVVASSSGVVVHTSEMTTGYGKIVVLKHTLGYNLRRLIKEVYKIDTQELYSIYAHLNDIVVATGNEVVSGAIVGHVGKSGNSKTSHLHFEIYAPIGELGTKDWRFYPIGWSKEKIQQYWLPAYKFIESTKNLESYESFLGKNKEYWLSLEKDNASLAEQLKKIDGEWALRVEKLEKHISSLEGVSAKEAEERKKIDISIQKERDDFVKKLQAKSDEITGLKTRNSEILANNAQTYTIAELLRLMIKSLTGRK